MISNTSYREVSRQWRTKINESPDYLIVRNDSVFRAGFSRSYILESDYQATRNLKDGLMARYNGMVVEEVFDGTEIDTPDGECFVINTPTDIRVPRPDPEQVRKRLLLDLTLIQGIGPVTAGRLRRRGHRTIEDLLSFRRFRARAEECVDRIRNGTPADVVSLIERRHSSSHPLSLLASGLYGSEAYLFLDLETLGFFSRPIILFGFATIVNQRLVVHQVLVRKMGEEFPALGLVGSRMKEKPVIVSYNGKTFDIPYLISRAAFYGDMMEKPGHHIDLLHASRRSAGHLVRDCRLGTIEQHFLGTRRTHDLPGSMVPEFYETYLHSGNPGPLVPIVEHNLQDVTSLGKLLSFFLEGPA